MIRRLLRVVMCAAALTAVGMPAASADPLEASLALTVNALEGHHEINGGHVDRLNFAPLPLAELTLRRRNDSVRIEGLPPATFGYSTAGDGAQSTRLSIVNAAYRRAFRRGIFAGIGQTVYNQFTTYGPVDGSFFYSRGSIIELINGSEVQYSRVTGMRFELGRTIAFARDRVEYWAAVNPKMHGVQYTRIPTFLLTCGPSRAPARCRQLVDTFSDPENATQVDLSVRVAHRVSAHGEVLLGLRYLNYAAHYDALPGQLADHNVGFAPTVGFRTRL